MLTVKNFNHTYLITFKDYDDTVLSSERVVEWKMPITPSVNPRQGYQFTWWSPSVGVVTQDQIYTATYEELITCLFQDWNYKELATVQCAAWNTPVYPYSNPTRAWYTFTWWDPALWPVYQYTKYTATYQSLPRDYQQGSCSKTQYAYMREAFITKYEWFPISPSSDGVWDYDKNEGKHYICCFGRLRNLDNKKQAYCYWWYNAIDDTYYWVAIYVDDCPYSNQEMVQYFDMPQKYMTDTIWDYVSNLLFVNK